MKFLRLAAFANYKFGLTVLCCNMAQVKVQRLMAVKGTEKINDIVYYPPENLTAYDGNVIFFGGDVQDFPESMLTHRDNKRHVRWNLENTAEILHRKFPNRKVFVVRPSRMHLKTFSCFDNFVSGNDIGSPQHVLCTDGLKHLRDLLRNAKYLTTQSHCETEDSTILVGFSKGCVVLNQLLYAFAELVQNGDNGDLERFVRTIEDMYWLDGGHSGGSNTWVTDKEVLRNVADRKFRVHIDVTPYQVKCEMRPWNGKEEKAFRETLKHFGVDVQRRLHFEDQVMSLEWHFKVLEEF